MSTDNKNQSVSHVDPTKDIVIDWVADTATIFGIRYSLEIFRTWATVPLGTALEIISRDDGALTVHRLDLDDLRADRIALHAKVQASAARNGELVDMIERLCNGLENYRNTAPWGDDDEDALTEAREMAAGLDVPFEIPQHFDDAAIDKFSAALKAKMAEGRAKGRQGWETCPPPELSNMLRNHVEKGDPRDVALYCMMHWHKGATIAVPSPSKRVYLVATGETWGGLETYTRHEAPTPLADQEMLLAAVPSVPSWAQISSEQIPSWPHESLVRFARAANNEMIRLCAWIREFNDGKPSKIQLADDTMRAIRTRALDEFGTGQAQGELWDQILMRETARTIQAAAKGGA